LKKSILEFCGVKPVKVTAIGIIKTADVKKREQWLNKVAELGRKHL
ncbi:MAG: flavodoxin family protein, partial [Flavobacteriales bacterium]